MTKADHNYVPTDYDDLYRHYMTDEFGPSLTHQLVRHFIPFGKQDEWDDLVNEVFLRIMDKKQLEKFDPNKANFGGVIFYVSRSICVNYLSRNSRNPLGELRGGSLQETSEEEEFVQGTYQLDRILAADQQEDEIEISMEWAEAYQNLLDWAGNLAAKPKSKRDRSILPMLQMILDVGPDVDALSEALGVTTSTIHNWLTYVREKSADFV